MAEKPYRPCVVGVFRNPQGQLLVGRRADLPAWQFPQGGIDSGETPEEALYREMMEELGCDKFRILYASSKTIAYDFPSDMTTRVSRRYRGQRQYWFLCEFSPPAAPDLRKASSREFDDLTWITPGEALSQIISWKKAAYHDGMRALGIEIT